MATGPGKGGAGRPPRRSVGSEEGGRVFLSPTATLFNTVKSAVSCTHRYSTDQMQGIRQTQLPSRVNVFVSLYKPI